MRTFPRKPYQRYQASGNRGATIRSTWFRSPLRSLTTYFIAGVLAACANPVERIEGGPANVRVINSVFQGPSATAVPIAVDYLFDSLDQTPSLFGLEPLSIGTASSPHYIAMRPDIHSFVVRLAGDTGSVSSLYTTSTSLPWLPRQYLNQDAAYTIVVAGILPASGLIPNNTIPFVALRDDPFAPPYLGGAYQSRFHVVNAAPYTAAAGTGATVTIYVTPGEEDAPTVTALSNLASFGTAAYRASSPYVNVTAGTYWVTISIGTTRIIHQQRYTFEEGDVRSLILQSTAAGSTPSPSNHSVQNILNATY